MFDKGTLNQKGHTGTTEKLRSEIEGSMHLACSDPSEIACTSGQLEAQEVFRVEASGLG